MSSITVSNSPFSPVLTLAKVFGLNSSASPTTINRYLFGYSLSLVAIYLTILSFRLFGGEDEQIFTINKIVVYLHLICYTAVFFASILGNWINSRVLSRNLWKLEVFDRGLRAVDLEANYQKMRHNFYVLLFACSSIYIYVVAADMAIDGVKDLVKWFSIYISLTINFFCVFIVIFALFLLKERYEKLKVYFEEMLGHERLGDVKKFTDFYIELTEISNSTLKTFSLQISAMFLLVLVVTTSNAYMMLKMEFSARQYLLIINSLFIHCFEMVALVCAYSFTRAKAENLVASSARLITGVPQSSTTFKENMECFFLIREHRFSVVIFGMFSLEPSVLLSVAASITSYLIVMIQFKDNEGVDVEPRSDNPALVRLMP